MPLNKETKPNQLVTYLNFTEVSLIVVLFITVFEFCFFHLLSWVNTAKFPATAV